jgi:hypothetical protein
MKPLFGARPAQSFTRSKYWIAASRKREGAVLGLERELTSIANDGRLGDHTFVSPRSNSLRVSSWTHHKTPKRFSTFWQFLDAIVPEETP